MPILWKEEMTEAVLKSELVKQARESLPKFVIQRHEDRITHGVPDISVDGNKVGSWIEVKFANPTFKTRGIQELTMSRLSRATHAYYVVYADVKGVRRTYIVEPEKIGSPMDEWGTYTTGFDHKWVVEYIKEVHNVHNNGS